MYTRNLTSYIFSRKQYKFHILSTASSTKKPILMSVVSLLD